MSAIMRRPPGFKLGDLIPDNGYSRCYGCHRPWWATGRHVGVHYTSSRSQFALCARCWNTTTPYERLRAHLWVCGEWDRTAKGNGHTHSDPSIFEIERRLTEAIWQDDPDMWARDGETDA